jgi:hypothetical protein
MALTGAEILDKSRCVTRPFILGTSWNDAPPGGTVKLTVAVTNPDSINWTSLFVTLLVGPGNIASTADRALLAINQSFPDLTLPHFPGATLAAGATQSLF